MVDNDKLLEDFGSPSLKYLNLEGDCFVELIHAIPVGKRNVKVLKIREAYSNIDERFAAVKKIWRIWEVEKDNIRLGWEGQ